VAVENPEKNGEFKLELPKKRAEPSVILETEEGLKIQTDDD